MSRAWRETHVLRPAAVKMKNRRADGFLMADGTVLFRFKRLMPDRTIQVTRIRLSLEAVRAMGEVMVKLGGPEAGMTCEGCRHCAPSGACLTFPRPGLPCNEYVAANASLDRPADSAGTVGGLVRHSGSGDR